MLVLDPVLNKLYEQQSPEITKLGGHRKCERQDTIKLDFLNDISLSCKMLRALSIHLNELDNKVESHERSLT